MHPMVYLEWSFIFDQNHEDEELYTLWNKLNSKSINNTSISNVLSSVQTNWVFMNGRTRHNIKGDVRKTLKAIKQTKLQMKNIVVVDMMKDKQSTFKALQALWDMAIQNDDREPSLDTHIISIVENTIKPDELKDIIDTEDYELGGYQSICINAVDFANASIRERIFPAPYIISGEGIPDSERPVYLAEGIKFIDSDDSYEKISLWDNFYSGRQITTFELNDNKDVFPRGLEHRYYEFRRRIEQALMSEPLSTHFKIKHLPGAGGTTVARRLARYMQKELVDINVIPVFVVSLKPETADMISKLSETTDTRCKLLIISDDKEIDRNSYSQLINRVKLKGLNPVYLRIEHELRLQGEMQNVLEVNSVLVEDSEINRFDEKFKNAFPALSRNETEKLIEEIKDGSGKETEMIYYPYTFSEAISQKSGQVDFLLTNSFVKRWFQSIHSDTLRNLCGYIAWLYQFTPSNALDIYTVGKLWRNGDIRALSDFPKEDLYALNKLFKTVSEGVSTPAVSSLVAPRYQAFVKTILETWRPGWKNSLAVIAKEFINILQEINSNEENEQTQELLSRLFIQQSRKDDITIVLPKLADRFSLLIGCILDSTEGFEGASGVFKELIVKYPKLEYLKLHYGRLLFEYANNQNYHPDDNLYTIAYEYISEALRIKDIPDDFFHVKGMYWHRRTMAVYTAFKSSQYNREETENLMMEYANYALECFSRCNELNRGTSQYGYVSTANLIFYLIDKIKKIRKIESNDNRLYDSDPFLKYLDYLDEAIYNLNSGLYEEVDTEMAESIRFKYLKLFGELDKALRLAQDGYDNATEDATKISYGHRIASIIENNGPKGKIMYGRELYSNMSSTSKAQLTQCLCNLVDLGDIRSAERLFHLYRYTYHDRFGEGKTNDALNRWKALAEEHNDLKHKLRAFFYSYVSYAAKLLSINYDDENTRKEYLNNRQYSRDLVEALNKYSYDSIVYLGKIDRDKWDCILDPEEARSGERGKYTYAKTCHRLDAKVIDIIGKQCDCEIGQLQRISASSNGLYPDDKGRAKLTHGVIGFRYRGIGLYDFTIDRTNSEIRLTENEEDDFNQDSATLVNVKSDEQNNTIVHNSKQDNRKESTSRINIFQTIREALGESPASLSTKKEKIYKPENERPKQQLKVLGKIDLNAINKKK